MSQECLICFDNVENKQDKVFCLVCNKKVHYTCFQRWSKKKKKVCGDTLDICIHCQQNALLVQKRSFFSKCCPWF